eukprot:9839970-Alexandrium_andersonii.AAC.1
MLHVLGMVGATRFKSVRRPCHYVRLAPLCTGGTLRRGSSRPPQSRPPTQRRTVGERAPTDHRSEHLA